MLTAQHLNFEYDGGHPILKNINFSIEKSEFITILGESGSGKSTLLKLIYGLEDPTKGEILYNNELVKGPKHSLVPGHPQMKFVPQEYNLLDSVTVFENVGKYLSNFNLPKKERDIRRALRAVNLLNYKDEFTSRMSGGQRQRVSIASAMAARPEVLLLDEPYGHLDRSLKFEIRNGIFEWAKENQCTVILTTHDMDDAMGFSDRVFIIKNGRIIQKSTPEELKNHPKSEYVVGLLGEYSVFDSTKMKKLFGVKIGEKEKSIVYPFEFEMAEKGSKFRITEIRFRGRDYLVKAKNKETEVCFFSDLKPEKSEVFLKLKNYRTVPK